ncbi:hypothetical protein [Alienimonas sp. DA493]|uniref:hypothetical protein n=1 Tax=Alienimonas sp. DA493 TaxID=3373605 RepID=UPI0037548AF9
MTAATKPRKPRTPLPAEPPAGCRRIKVLSLRQPWASFVIHGFKWCENRTWRTNHRGELWIHASAGRDDAAWCRELEAEGLPLPRSAILGRVDLRGCWETSELLSCQGGDTDHVSEDLHETVCDIADDIQDRVDAKVYGPEGLDETTARRQVEDETYRFGWDFVEAPEPGDDFTLWGWVLTDRVPLSEPYPIPGRLNVWTADVPADALALPLLETAAK